MSILLYAHITHQPAEPLAQCRIFFFKFKTDCICIVHLASNAWSLQENLVPLAANKSVCTIVAI